ncbi:MAG: helix-turn-helix domain-containing protein [Betaproteobacteria bacterium]
MNEAQTNNGQASAPLGAGAALLMERRRQGLSLGDISRQLKLSVRQVEALERDDYSAFTGPVFVHGFIRNYAKLLNLGPDALIRAADQILIAEAPAREPVAAAASPLVARRRKIGLLPALSAGAAIAVVAIAVFVGNRSVSKPARDEPVMVTAEKAAQTRERDPAAKPAASKPAAAQPAAKLAAKPSASDGVAGGLGGRAILRMVFDQESWVQIKDRNGDIIFGQLNSAGSRRSVSGEPPFDLVVGNAAGVRLTYKDQSVDLSPHTQVDVARLTLE